MALSPPKFSQELPSLEEILCYFLMTLVLDPDLRLLNFQIALINWIFALIFKSCHQKHWTTLNLFDLHFLEFVLPYHLSIYQTLAHGIVR